MAGSRWSSFAARQALTRLVHLTVILALLAPGAAPLAAQAASPTTPQPSRYKSTLYYWGGPSGVVYFAGGYYDNVDGKYILVWALLVSLDQQETFCGGSCWK